MGGLGLQWPKNSLRCHGGSGPWALQHSAIGHAIGTSPGREDVLKVKSSSPGALGPLRRKRRAASARCVACTLQLVLSPPNGLQTAILSRFKFNAGRVNQPAKPSPAQLAPSRPWRSSVPWNLSCRQGRTSRKLLTRQDKVDWELLGPETLSPTACSESDLRLGSSVFRLPECGGSSVLF